MKWNLSVEFPILAIGNLLIKGGGGGGKFFNSYVAYL